MGSPFEVFLKRTDSLISGPRVENWNYGSFEGSDESWRVERSFGPLC